MCAKAVEKKTNIHVTSSIKKAKTKISMTAKGKKISITKPITLAEQIGVIEILIGLFEEASDIKYITHPN